MEYKDTPRLKSEELTPKERSLFKKWVAKKKTIVAAARDLKKNRNTISKVLATGSANPDTISEIRTVINQ